MLFNLSSQLNKNEDDSEEYCRYEIQRHHKTNKLRIKHYGDFYDNQLENQVNEEFKKLSS